MGLKVRVYLDSIYYGGENIGNDWSIDFTVNGNKTAFERKISHGKKWDTHTKLFTTSIEADLDVNVSVTFMEQDPVYDDTGGSGQTAFTIDFKEAEYFNLFGLHSVAPTAFFGTITGDQEGDDSRKALLAFKLVAYIGKCAKGDKDIKAGVEKPNSHKVLGNFEVPALTPPDNIGLLIKETLEGIGDPGGIADKVDKFMNANSIKASDAFDVYEISSVEICEAVYVCEEGAFVFSKYQNCEPRVSQRKTKTLQLPAEKDPKDVLVENLKDIFDEFKK